MVAGATVVLVRLTGRYVSLTQALLDQSREDRAAAVVVDLVFDGFWAWLSVTNSGSKPATDVSFLVTEKGEWGSGGRPSQLKVVSRGISYLPPGRTLKYAVGALDWKAISTGSEATVSIKLAFESEGNRRDREFVIDLAQYLESARENSPNEALVRAIDRLTDHTGRVERRFAFELKKQCVECSEDIPGRAKRCSHCMAVQPVPEPPDAPGGA